MIPTHLFHPEDGPLQTRYLALRAASNVVDYKRINLSLEERARQHELQAAIERPWSVDRLPQRQPRGRDRQYKGENVPTKTKGCGTKDNWRKEKLWGMREAMWVHGWNDFSSLLIFRIGQGHCNIIGLKCGFHLVFIWAFLDLSVRAPKCGYFCKKPIKVSLAKY